MSSKLWIVAPCFYDFASLFELKKRAQSVLAQAHPQIELRVVVIDDTGGQDIEIGPGAQSAGIICLHVPYNLGHQGAIVLGLRKLAGILDDNDIVVTMDSDGEDSPEDIPTLVAPLLKFPSNAFMVSLAQRTKRSEGLTFRAMYLCFKLFFQTLTGKVVRNGNFAAFRGWYAKNTLFHPYFDYCYSSSLLALSHQIVNVPLARGRRYYGQSRMTLVSLVSHGLRMLLPFSERIAVRGMIAACGSIFLTAVFYFSALQLAVWNTKVAVLMAVIFLPAIMFSVVMLAASWIFFHTFNDARAASLRYMTLSAGNPDSEDALTKKRTAKFVASGSIDE